jgi:hypothetical protein
MQICTVSEYFLEILALWEGIYLVTFVPVVCSSNDGSQRASKKETTTSRLRTSSLVREIDVAYRQGWSLPHVRLFFKEPVVARA